MGAVRKGVVGFMVIVLSLYFLAGMFGFLPYKYDYIKQNVNPSQGAEQTNTSGTLTIYYSPVTKAQINAPIKISVRVKDTADGQMQVGVEYWNYNFTHFINGGVNLTLTSGTKTDGTWTGEIPAMTNFDNISYKVVAMDFTSKSISILPINYPPYTIQIIKEQPNTIFGVNYVVFEIVGLILTLTIGYLSYGTDRTAEKKKSGWKKWED
jgi:hypothetical protein